MKRISFIILSLICVFASFGKSEAPTTFEIDYSFDSFGSNPQITTEEIKSRLKALQTEIEMTYSEEVKNSIESYMKFGRKKVASLLVRSAYYMPIFEKALRKAGLPEELKYLPIIESSLNAKATSYRGAAGLWQFMPGTAKGYDMEVSSSVDERRDPYISSEKACELLKKLYEKFGDWHLALAAYNAGPGTVQKALKKAGGDPSKHTFTSIKSYLPAETRKYVPLFIAMNYVMNYYTHHNIPKVEISNPFTTDKIELSQKESLRKIASAINIPLEDLRTLNPQYSSDVIPASSNRPCNLILPTNLAMEYREKNGLPMPEEEIIIKPANKVMASSSPASSNQKKDKLRNWNDYVYVDVPSKTNPNTFVRVLRKTSAETH